MGRALIFLLTVGLGPSAWGLAVEPAAQWLDEVPSAHTTANGPVSLAQARSMAVERFPGRVVRAETTGANGRRVHQIRILGADNRVYNVRIDAQNGAFL